MELSTLELKATLIEKARSVLGAFSLAKAEWTAGGVASALMTERGNLYTGICLDLACGIGFCAEHAAIATMLKARETRIEAIVAVNASGIISPCGRCRELMMQVNRHNSETQVFVNSQRVVLLKDLLPEYWLSAT